MFKFGKNNKGKEKTENEFENKVDNEARNTEVNKEVNMRSNQEKSIKNETWMLTEIRKNQIGPMVLKKEIDFDTIKSYSVQECIFLLKTMEHFQQSSPLENYDVNHNLIYQLIFDKVKGADTIYVLMDRLTNFPFVGSGYGEIYSNSNLADLAMEHYGKTHRSLEVRAVNREKTELPDNISLFAYFYFLGIEKIIIDNGVYSLAINREEILPSPDYSGVAPISIPVVNASLRISMLTYLSEARWRVNYEGREENIKSKEASMLEQVKKARYLVPMKSTGAESSENNQVTFKNGGTLSFAMILTPDKKPFIPMFTDWLEFQKVYSKEEWGGMIMTLEDGKAIAKDQEGFVINPQGENVIFTNELINELKI